MAVFFFPCVSPVKMSATLQKLITPIFKGLPEPPRNKVTVVGVGQVGMACAVSILLRVSFWVLGFSSFGM